MPGIGQLGAIALATVGLLGVGGIVAGAAAGGALESSLSQGLTKDELFVYEDAIRTGHSVVVALVAPGAEQAHLRGDRDEVIG